ncbi:serine/threonine-protein kinase [Sorangium sp. So ce854]|uniref:serine/threonine-protein kinase n=1 Tax=Sorangium sp. So ce854 TaxID=3133322 RepID=UPI003F5E7B73
MIASPEDVIGSIFHRYHILEFLGRGGAGACYKVQHDTLGRELCLKLTYPLACSSQAIMTAVSRTVRALGSIDHPSVIKLHDFGTMEIDGDLTFYACMDLLSRETMRSWPQERTLTEIMDALTAVADALHAAHSCRFFDDIGCEQVGLLHGDIKPDNIVISHSGRPVVTDFMMPDLQRMVSDEARERFGDFGGPLHEPLTAVLGTPGYMPPEQEDRGLLTVRSDIFALGVTAAEILASRDDGFYSGPFGLLDRTKPAALDERLWDYLSMMMSPRPEDRPSSMADVSARFREIARRIE